MSRNVIRTADVSAASLALVALGAAAPARADVGENGTKYCGGSTPFSYVQFKTKGYRSWVAPGKGTQYGESGSTSSWYTGSRQGVDGGGSWFASGATNLDQAYTNGVCKNYG